MSAGTITALTTAIVSIISAITGLVIAIQGKGKANAVDTKVTTEIAPKVEAAKVAADTITPALNALSDSLTTHNDTVLSAIKLTAQNSPNTPP